MYRIKEILKEKGINQQQLAEMMNVSPQYISGIVREADTPSVNTLIEIAKLLKVPVSSLFDDYKGGIIECPHCGKEINIKISI